MSVSCNKEFWHQLASDLSVWLHKGPSTFNLQYMCRSPCFFGTSWDSLVKWTMSPRITHHNYW